MGPQTESDWSSHERPLVASLRDLLPTSADIWEDGECEM